MRRGPELWRLVAVVRMSVVEGGVLRGRSRGSRVLHSVSVLQIRAEVGRQLRRVYVLSAAAAATSVSVRRRVRHAPAAAARAAAALTMI